MKRIVLCALVVGATLLPGSAVATARTYYGFKTGVAGAPPAPTIRVAREPRLVRATDAMVYVVDDEAFTFDGDLFRYGQYWFAYRKGYWYRGRSHRGPYTLVEVRTVPRAIIGVPRALWKHHPLGKPPQPAVAALRNDGGHDGGHGRDTTRGRSHARGK